jgi:hypothetical protein
MADVEVRKVETTYHETGLGQEPRTDVTYELGSVIAGKWVPFGSVSESRLASMPDDKPADAEPDAPEGE